MSGPPWKFLCWKRGLGSHWFLGASCETLQLLSTILLPAGGEKCLEEADQLNDVLPRDEFQTELFREDNRKMKADRMEWRIKNDMVGKGIEGVGENPNEGPLDEQLKLDRDVDEKLRQELE